MIDKIFDLGDTTVREVMVPLVDVVMLPETASPRDAIALIQQRGFSRLPDLRATARPTSSAWSPPWTS